MYQKTLKMFKRIVKDKLFFIHVILLSSILNSEYFRRLNTVRYDTLTENFITSARFT